MSPEDLADFEIGEFDRPTAYQFRDMQLTAVADELGWLVASMMIERLRHDEPEVRKAAAGILGHIGYLASPKVRQMIEQASTSVERPEKEVLDALRTVRAHLLHRTFESTEILVPAEEEKEQKGSKELTAEKVRTLMGQLEDEDPVVRHRAAEELGKYVWMESNPASAAVPALIERLDDDDDQRVRVAASNALARMGPPAVALALREMGAR